MAKLLNSKKAAARAARGSSASLSAEFALGRIIVLGKMLEHLGTDQDPVILEDINGDDLFNLGRMIRDYAAITRQELGTLLLEQDLGIIREAANG